MERIALTQHSMLRMYAFEAGFFTNCLEAAMVGPADPEILKRCQVGDNIEVPRTQNRAFWLAQASKSSAVNPISPPLSSASRPRPSASIAAPSKISIASASSAASSLPKNTKSRTNPSSNPPPHRNPMETQLLLAPHRQFRKPQTNPTATPHSFHKPNPIHQPARPLAHLRLQ